MKTKYTSNLGNSLAALRWCFGLTAAVLVLSVQPVSAGMIDRWRAEDLNGLNDGDAVGTWASASNRVANGASGVQPIFKKNATPAGGAVVRFNRSFMTAANSPFGGATAFSLAVVFKASALGAGADANPWYQCSGLVDAEQGGVTIDWGTVFNGSGHVAFGIGSPDITTPSTGPSLVDGNFHVAVFTWGGGAQAVYVDQQTPVTRSGVPTAARMSAGFAFGGILTGEGGADRRFIGDMAEVRFYNTSLSATEASNVIAGLTDDHILGNWPVIVSFSASTNQVLIGTPVTLSWVVRTNCDSIAIDNGVGYVTGFSNSVVVVPRTNTTYTMTTSNELGSRLAQVTVSVDQGIPVANNLAVDCPQNVSLPITLSGIDPQGSNLTFAVVTGPLHGLLAGTGPALTFTPDPDYYGNDQFTFKVNDGEFDSPPATVSIRVLPPPSPPQSIVLTTTRISTSAGPGSFIAALRAPDVNPDDTHTFALVPGAGDADNGRFAIEGNQLKAGPTYAGGLGSTFAIRLRATDNTDLSVEQSFVLTVVEIARSIVINEIHYNPLDNTVFEEFIELHNPTTNDVDVSYWRLADAVDYVLEPGTIILAGGFQVIAKDPPTILARYGLAAFGPWSGGLNNEGASVTLLDANDQTVNQVNYRSEFPWPIGANGGGGSMALVNPALDNDLGSSWRTETPPSPGAINHIFAANAPPNIRQVHHTPQSPTSADPIVITAKVTDPDGVASVTLQYQIVTPGNYRSAIIPIPINQLNPLTTPGLEPAPDPAFESPTNWISIPMVDDGAGADAVAGDTIYTVTLPPQANRVLLRYRIVITDSLGASRRAPFEDDPSLNFACFVYDGIPSYAGVSSAALQTLPVYFLLTRAQDFDACAAYTGTQLGQFVSGNLANEGRFVFNWEGAFVYEGEVYDHVRYRLEGANGRYQQGRRSWAIRYNDGRYLAAKDLDGQPYPKKWSRLNIAKGQSNRQTLTFSLNEAISYGLWNKVGVPSPSTHHMHWRVIRGAQEQPDLFNGDFYGVFMIQENYDVRFLDAHQLAKGNLYKLINADRGVPAGGNADMLGQQRYQGPFAVTNAQDAVNVQAKLTGSGAIHDTASLLAYVNYPKFYLYHAIVEAVRDYDFWPSCNKNAAWYFEPAYGASNNFFGRHWTLPWDATDSWGPTWNGGEDMGFNGIFPSSYTGGDAGQNLELQVDYFNTMREVRELLIQPDQVNPMIDAYAARLAAVIPADLARWSNAPTANGSYLSMPQVGPALAGGLAAYVQDMKNFLFVGGSYGWWLDRGSIAAGGWAVARLDPRSADAANVPAKPVITYVGLTNYPVTDLFFRSSAFSDPQGAATFAAMQWRVAEITTNTTVTNPAQLKFEWDAAWDSGELTVFTNQVQLPALSVIPGKIYRARVRHKDITGRWSNWSAPVQFVASPVDLVSILQTNLVLSEIMYNPPNEGTTLGDEFEFLEFKNIGANTLDLSGLTFSAGITFTFTNGTVLAPGQFFVLGRNSASLQSKYPGLVVNGVYTGRLSDGGETITLKHPYGTKIIDLAYSDRAPWPVAADGYGFSLVLDPTAPAGYRASTQLGGSPGTEDAPSTLPRILVNEIFSSAVAPALDAIELYNPGAADADLSGWFLTDDAGYPWKYRITNGTVLAAGGYMTFDESEFNPTPGTGTSFSLSSFGEEVYLFSGDAAHQLTGYSHGFAFDGAARGETFGRYTNSVGEEQFPAQIIPTLGTNNAGPRVGPVVINEVHYHPPAGEEPFIELLNISTNDVPFFDRANPTNTWRFSGVAYVFPTNLVLEPNRFMLLVATNPADFRARYGIAADIQVLGPYAGTLQHGGERLALESPDLPTTNGVPFFTVDAVRYNDKEPWPTGADGFGASLQRKIAAQYGDDPINWTAAVPSPGRPVQALLPPVITTQPQSHTVVAYTDLTLSVAATGDEPLAYQWLLDGSSLPGATGPALGLTHIQPGQAGSYSVWVFNGAGSALSDSAPLTVLMPVMITQQPQPQKANPGTNVSFSVAAVGNGTITYQWRFNGTNISGAISATLSLNNVQLANDGLYDVRVADDVSAAISDAALLLISVKPTITQQPTPTNVVAMAGDTVSFSISATGRMPLSYRWRKNGAAVTNITLYETTCVYTINNVQFTHAGNYDVQVTNLAGAASLSSKASLTVLSPPVITAQPTNLTVNAGASAIFRVTVGGTTNFGYYWYFQGTNAVGGTNSTSQTAHSITVTNVQAGNEGPYFVVVSNLYGLATSDVATLLIRKPPTILVQPSNQVAVVGSAVTFSVGMGGTEPLSYRWRFNETNLAGGTNVSLTLTNVQMTNAGGYQVVVTNLLGSVTSLVATLQVMVLEVPRVDSLVMTGGPNGPVTINFTGATGQSYTVFYRDELDRGDWVALTNIATLPAAQAVSTVDDTTAGRPQRFYRVVTPLQP
jgi:hypothetical protein